MWHEKDGEMGLGALPCVGFVKYYFTHSVTLCGKPVKHIFAYVKWYKQAENQHGYRPPATLWHARQLEVPGPACFMPVQRIMTKVVSAKDVIDNTHYFMACPRHTKLYT